uniref:CYRIA/CYRIB Rac1 binding domain-containing protein n=1 Tax=Anopheles quadriannulatus TaxID=34691 RepID=A0A182XP41_ANOQN
MGKLLSLLARDESTCCTPKTYDVFLDFENAAPTDLEREVYEEVDHVLRQSEIVLDEIQCYKVTFVVMMRWRRSKGTVHSNVHKEKHFPARLEG